MIHSSTKFLRFVIPVVLASLLACNTTPEQKKPVIGTVDSLSIASDTVMQLGIERSYEYHKSIVANSKLVYDIIGFGGSATKGEYAILQRGADNRADTIVKGPREGTIVNAFLADLNGNKISEIYIVTQSVGSGSYANITAFEIEAKNAVPISYKPETENGYMGHDSVYIEGNKIARVFPVYKSGDPNCCPTGGSAKVTYALNKTALNKVGVEVVK
jgi:hypothetical protein